jgi:hypothetical protein
MSILAGIVTKLLTGYVAKLATAEFAEWVLFQIAEAIVKNTKTKEDDKWLEKIKETVQK